MTVKDNSLGDRLNDFRNKQSPFENNKNQIDLPYSPIKEFFDSIIILIVMFIKSFTFGYSLKIIFSTDWNFLGYFCIGLGINFILQFIISLIHNNS